MDCWGAMGWYGAGIEFLMGESVVKGGGVGRGSKMFVLSARTFLFGGEVEGRDCAFIGDGSPLAGSRLG